MIVSGSNVQMSLLATNLKRFVRMRLHNEEKKKNSVKLSVKESVKRKISTRSVRNKGKKT